MLMTVCPSAASSLRRSPHCQTTREVQNDYYIVLSRSSTSTSTSSRQGRSTDRSAGVNAQLHGSLGSVIFSHPALPHQVTLIHVRLELAFTLYSHPAHNLVLYAR